MKHAEVSKQFIELAEQLADASAEVIRGYFRRPLQVDDKADASPVTIADRAAEQVMRALIQQHFPEHGIYGEETGVTASDAEYVWVLDPIDGTKSFITGKATFGTLIALLHHGQPVLGVINQPILRERWLGAAGLPATLNGETVVTRSCGALSQALLYATSPEMFRGTDKTAFDRVSRTVKHTLYGADCYAYALLSMGFVDLVVEASLSPYDYCALVPVIEAAGGVLTDWAGQPLGLHSDGRVVASGDAQLHAQVVNLLYS
jgi:inositol-phosphate phosphatase/L-galactose 1-phosphate phosphatase/histidinol-phosphatase